MKYETTLPEGFTGTFYFTNYSDEEFAAKWDGKEYIFPAGTTSPMIIPEHSPLEIQQIRKKFAKDLAEREFFKTKHYEHLRLREGVKDEYGMLIPRGQGMGHAGTYSMDMLTPLIQKALEQLPASSAFVRKAPTVRLEEKLTRNADGEIGTAPIKTDKDLESLAKGTMEARVLG